VFANNATAAMLPMKRMTDAFAHTAGDRFFRQRFSTQFIETQRHGQTNNLPRLP